RRRSRHRELGIGRGPGRFRLPRVEDDQRPVGDLRRDVGRGRGVGVLRLRALRLHRQGRAVLRGQSAPVGFLRRKVGRSRTEGVLGGGARRCDGEGGGRGGGGGSQPRLVRVTPIPLQGV